MTTLSPTPLRNAHDIAVFERSMPLAQRLGASSIYDVFVASAGNCPDHTALTMLMTGAADEEPRRVSYHELLGLVRRCANMFHAVGGKRPGVAYMLPNLVETHATLWGAETAGFAVPINFLLQAEHIAELLQAAGASILVTLGPHPQLDIWQKALQVKALLPGVLLLRVTPPSTPAMNGVLDFHTLLAAQPADHLVFGEPGRGDDIAAYFHTGGTTGTPKLVVHTHHNQLAAAYGGSVLTHMSDSDVLTMGLPLFHVAATIFCGLSCFMSGVHLLLMSPAGFRNPAMVQSIWHIVERYGATMVGAVPTALGALLEVPIGDCDISGVRVGFCGAASLPRAVGERFTQLTDKPLYEVLGMTEAAGLISIDPASGVPAPGSVGYPLPYTEVVIRRLQAEGLLGAACEPNEIGVLTVRGPTVSPGYKDPQQNQGVFVDGVLNSGDLAYKDADGRIYIAGRSKDLIIRSGHNIDPQMIENAMATHPAVALAAAVAMPDAYAGELPVCYVSLRSGAVAQADELQAHAQKTIAERPAWPRHIHIVDAIPLTTVGKIYKPQLRLDATQRLLAELVHGKLGLAQARIEVAEGGKRGMRVTVTLPAAHADAVLQVQQALAGFVFESVVAVA